MVGLPSLEVYTSNITEENNKFEIYRDKFDEFSFKNIEDEPEENLSISDLTPYHLQHENRGPRIIEAFKKVGLEKSNTDGNIIQLKGYARSPIRHFESYPRMVVGLDGDDIQLTLKQNNSNFVTYEFSPGIYTVEDISKVVYTMGGHEGTLKFEFDDISMKTKLFLTPFGSTFGPLRFDENSFSKYFIRFYTVLGL